MAEQTVRILDGNTFVVCDERGDIESMASEPTGGYGLFLVERLTRRWGMTREAQRTRVWFEFDYTGSR